MNRGAGKTVRRWPATTEFDAIAAAFPWTRDARGVGDDAALVGKRGLLCCDALAEGVHFRRDWSRMSDVGWKAVAQNVADILAMGGVPTEAVWSVGLGKDWTPRDFSELAKGALEACAAYGCSLVGGDTVRTTGPGFVSLSLNGTLPAKPWLRSGARAGDRLILAGTLGFSAAGLALLEAGVLHGAPREVLSRHRRPCPPAELAASLRALGSAVHAAIDISDGLSSECHHLALASGVSIELDPASITCHRVVARAARLLGKSPLPWLLNGGEEHSLLVCVSKKALLPPGVVEIGKVGAGKGVWLSGDGEALPPGGWSHR